MTMDLLQFFVVSLSGLASAAGTEVQSYIESKYPAEVIKDADLDITQLLRKYNYPSETHFVTTEDNYILRMHRIPKPGGRPVFLMHGILDSSETWIIMGPWAAFGYYLYNLGYDVWMGNARGNVFSRNHTIFNPDTDKSFWRFTWHEIGYYDLPAMIDYVLNNTQRSKLAYFGHSQGTTSSFVLCSERPEYNEKITVLSAIAPVAFMAHHRLPLMSVARNFVTVSKNTLTEFMPRNSLLLQTCFRSKVAEDTCLDLVYQILGKDTKMYNTTMLPVVLGHLPSGCNFKQLVHYLQLIDSGRFSQFDFGPTENIRRYSKINPPDYPIEKITAPVALYYSYNDPLAGVTDVQNLAKLLPNVVENNLFANRKWNHMTPVWGVQALDLTHKRMVEVIQKYEE